MNLQRIKGGAVKAAADTVGVTVSALYERAVLSGGLDFSVSRHQFAAIMAGDIDGISDWSVIFFSFDELMAYYCASGASDAVDSFLVAACLIYCELADSMGNGDVEITKAKLKYFDLNQLASVGRIMVLCDPGYVGLEDVVPAPK